jgi:hypothetical protein
MSSKTISLGPLALVWLMGGSTLMAANKDRILFDFEKPDAVRQWQTVNDGVMGGVYDIPQALPEVVPRWLPAPDQRGMTHPGLHICGDHTTNPSIQGAMVAGRCAAEAVLGKL